MKKIFFSILLSPLFSYAEVQTSPNNSLSPSKLAETVVIEGFGEIKYRAPIHNNTEFPILLVHGIYGGASHRAFNQILPLLDQAQQKVYILDLPGIGDSAKPKRAYTMADLDLFLERFIDTVIKDRTTVVAESLMSASALKVAAVRPDLVRRLILLSPTGVSSLNQPPSQREQQLYDRLFNDDNAGIQFYKNLLVDNSLNFYLKFAFYDDSLINDVVLNDYREMRENIDQRFISLSFVGGQLYRSFAESAENVFVPSLLVFGAKYENFADNKTSTAEDFKMIRPDFEYLEIENSGSLVQREKPSETVQAILNFSVKD